jgi:hypothetical protein
VLNSDLLGTNENGPSEEGPLPVFGTGRLSVEPLVVIGLRQGPLNEKRPPNGGGLLLHCGPIMTY